MNLYFQCIRSIIVLKLHYRSFLIYLKYISFYVGVNEQSRSKITSPCYIFFKKRSHDFWSELYVAGRECEEDGMFVPYFAGSSLLDAVETKFRASSALIGLFLGVHLRSYGQTRLPRLASGRAGNRSNSTPLRAAPRRICPITRLDTFVGRNPSGAGADAGATGRVSIGPRPSMRANAGPARVFLVSLRSVAILTNTCRQSRAWLPGHVNFSHFYYSCFTVFKGVAYER